MTMMLTMIIMVIMITIKTMILMMQMFLLMLLLMMMVMMTRIVFGEQITTTSIRYSSTSCRIQISTVHHSYTKTKL